MKIKKGDTVLVVAGNDRGQKGKVIHAYPDQQKVLVEGVNRIRKHTKVTTTQRGAKSGGIVTQEAPIHVSKVMLLAGDRPTRVGYRSEPETRPDGREKTKRVRVARRTNEDI